MREFVPPHRWAGSWSRGCAVTRAWRRARLAIIFALAASGAFGCAAAEDDRSTAPAEWSPGPAKDDDPRSADAGSSASEGDARGTRSRDEGDERDEAAVTGPDRAPPLQGQGQESAVEPAPAPSLPASESDDVGLPLLPDSSVLTVEADAAAAADRDGGEDLDASAVGDGWASGPGAVDAVANHIEARAAEPAEGASPGEQEASDSIVINEVESSGGVPGDWVELYNAGSTAVDLSGWTFKDSDDSHAYVLPEGPLVSVVQPGGYLVLDESAFEFGLGAPDSARLFDREGRLVAGTSWTVHAVTTYGRCPGRGTELVTTLAATEGAPNACALLGEGPIDAGVGQLDRDVAPPVGVADLPWPGGPEIATVDPPGAYAGNLSGLAYEPAGTGSPDTIWAVQNEPSLLYALQTGSSGESWLPLPVDGSDVAQALRYPDGSGAPDAEGITVAEWDASAVYVAAERDNLHDTVSRLSVLRYDVRSRTAELVASNEWNLTADLPVSAPNVGLEAITWVPDADLTAMGFKDERTSARYAPAMYPNHGTGVFFVGLESNGMIYAYALDHQTGAAYRVGTMTSGQRAVMDLAFDRELHQLWAYCDNTCGNRSTVLAMSQGSDADGGQFVVRAAFERPSALGDFNNEGIAFASERACVAGFKPFFWSDDSATEGHSIRRGTIPCRALP